MRKLDPKEFNNSYDYYVSLRKITEGFENPELNYFPPFASAFEIVLPYKFERDLTERGKDWVAKSNPLTQITSYYLSVMNGVDIRNKRIIGMRLSDIPPKLHEKFGATLSRWANKHVKLWGRRRDRFYLSWNLFHERNLSSFDIPEGGVYVNYAEAYINKTVELPFIGYLKEDLHNYTDLLKYKDQTFNVFTAPLDEVYSEIMFTDEDLATSDEDILKIKLNRFNWIKELREKKTLAKEEIEDND